MPTDIYFVRHAHAKLTPDKKRIDDTSPLSSLGKKQARLLAQRLKSFPFTAVYASPFARALETAQAVSKSHKIEVRIEHALEEFDWEFWPKATHRLFGDETRRLKHLAGYRKYSRLLGLGEERALRLLERICRENPDTAIAVVTHGNVIRALLTGVLGAHLVGFSSLEIGLASLTHLRISKEEGIKVISVSDASHLSGL